MTQPVNSLQRNGAPLPTHAARSSTAAPVIPDAASRAHGAAPMHTTPTGFEPALPKSKTLELLGQDGVVPFQAVVPRNAKIVWFNFELARELGFEVGPFDAMSPELHERLLPLLGYRALAPGESADGRPTMTLYADRYGETGSGRAGLYPYADLSAKGVGVTPLAVEKHDDFAHSHGGASLAEGLLEAVGGEVADGLLTHGSTRVLAIVDLHENTVYPDGGVERRAVTLRQGSSLRPAHLFRHDLYDPEAEYVPTSDSIPTFIASAQSSGLSADGEHDAGPVDLASLMRGVHDRQMQTFAEWVAHGALHGSPGIANLRLEGGAIDFGSFTALKGHAPAYVAVDAYPFGEEHERVSALLERTYAALQERAALEPERFTAPDIDFTEELDSQYDRHLTEQLLQTAGFRPTLAATLCDNLPDEAEHFLESARFLTGLHHAGENLDADTREVNASVVNAFALFAQLPALAALPHDQRLDHALVLLAPKPGTDAERSARLTQSIANSTARLLESYAALVEEGRGYAIEDGESPEVFDRAMQARAAFESRPMEPLIRARYQEAFRRVVDSYGRTGDTHAVRDTIGGIVADASRSVDGLFRQGTRAVLDGGLALQRRSLSSVRYSVHAFEDGRRELAIRLPVETRDDGTLALHFPRGTELLSPEDVGALRFRFTLDDWKTVSEVGLGSITPEPDVDGALTLRLEGIPVEQGAIHDVKGLFSTLSDRWLKDGEENFRGYTFAVPTQLELAEQRLEIEAAKV